MGAAGLDMRCDAHHRSTLLSAQKDSQEPWHAGNAGMLGVQTAIMNLSPKWTLIYFFYWDIFDGFPRRLSGKESACQCRRLGFSPWSWEDHLEKEMAIHSSTLAWKIPWTEEPGT